MDNLNSSPTEFSTNFHHDKWIIKELISADKSIKDIILICPDYDLKLLAKTFPQINFYIFLTMVDQNITLPSHIKIFPGDIFDTLPTSNIPRSDALIMTRVIEHIEFMNIFQFVYLASLHLKSGKHMMLTYPNFSKICNLLENTDPNLMEYQFLNYELFNVPGKYDSHKIFLNPEKIISICELEGFFTHQDTSELFSIDSNRKIYMRSWFIRK